MPDLNSVPPSPRPLDNSRRQSTQMPPPPVPRSPSLNILPSNQNAVNQGSTSPLPSPQLPPQQTQHPAVDPGVGSGPGPLRHPRPLTAAELHLQLEKEQEAVVNRLTRELSLLRAAQNASVVSNASSTSAANSTHEPPTESSRLSGSGFSIPTTQRHHRTSSAASHNLGMTQFVSHEGRSHQNRPPPAPMARQDSNLSRRSQPSSPGPQSILDPSNYFLQQRIPGPTSAPMGSAMASPGSGTITDQLSPGLMPATMRYEETAFYRSELETAKKENEALKRRVRDLERQVRTGRASEASRNRSESVSTTASIGATTPVGGVGIAGPRESAPQRPERERERGMTTQSITSVAGSVGVGVPEEEVKVGESAASSGLANKPQ